MQSRILAWCTILVIGCGVSPSYGQSTGHTTRSVDGVEIRFDVVGEGQPTLVFVHGWTLDRTFWEHQVAHFAPHVQSVTIDLAGHGLSGTGRADWTMEAFGSDVVAVLDELGLEDVILVGHSMGGAVVLEAALERPDRLRGVVLVDSFFDPDERMSADEREGILSAYRHDFALNVGGMVRQYLFAPDVDSLLADRIVQQMSSFDPAIGVASVEHLFDADYRDVFGQLDVPLVAINSDLYPTNRETMARYGMDVRIVHGVGHFPMVEAPEEFNRILAAVVDEWR